MRKVQGADAVLANRVRVDIQLTPELYRRVRIDHFCQRSVFEITHAAMEEAWANTAVGLYDSGDPRRVAHWRHCALESKGRAKVSNQTAKLAIIFANEA